MNLSFLPCTCDVYTKKEMTAPDCIRCKYEAKIKEVIEDEAVSFGMHIAAGIFEDENQVRGLYQEFKKRNNDKSE